MKRQIRQGVFETNSSSTHSITITDKTVYDGWVNGESMFNEEEQKFLPKNEAIEWNIKHYIGSDVPEYFIEHYKETGSISNAVEECENNGEKLDFNERDFELYCMYISYNEYTDYICDMYEYYKKTYKTKSGDEIVAFGYYGNDY